MQPVFLCVCVSYSAQENSHMRIFKPNRLKSCEFEANVMRCKVCAICLRYCCTCIKSRRVDSLLCLCFPSFFKICKNLAKFENICSKYCHSNVTQKVPRQDPSDFNRAERYRLWVSDCGSLCPAHSSKG